MTTRRSAFAPALLVSTVLAFALSGSARAQRPKLNVKLGLWEATTVVQMSGAPPVDTSQMTPEQRARVEAMMEQQKKTMAQPHTMRTCLTEEKLEKGEFGDNDKSCKHEIVSSSSTTYDVKFTCKPNDGTTTSGEWHFQAVTPEAVKGNADVTVARGAEKMVATSTIAAKWVGASCGDVK